MLFSLAIPVAVLTPQLTERVEVTPSFLDCRDSVVFDVDGDGDLDVVGVAHNHRSIRWIQNLGRDALGVSRFAAAVELQQMERFPDRLTAADVDGDGLADLLVTAAGEVFDADPNVYLARNLGGGVFDSAQALDPVSAAAGEVTVLDFDRDGLLDVIGSRNPTVFHREAVWARGLPGGGFAQFVPLPGDPLDARFSEAVDLDGDGWVDFVGLADGSSPVWYRNASGTLVATPFAPITTGPLAGLDALDIVPADFNGDGAIDLLCQVDAGSTFLAAVYLAQGPGIFGGPTSVPVRDRQLTPIDFDQDGDVDLVGAAPGSSRLSTREYVGGASLFGPRQPVGDIRVSGAGRLHAVDLDGDSVEDLAYASVTGRVAWVSGQGSSSAPFASDERPLTRSVRSPGSSTLGDVDGDGDLDLVLERWAAAPVLLRNLGFDRFGVSEPIRPDLLMSGAYEPELIDLDADGVMDLVFQASSVDREWLQGLGDGTFDTVRAIIPRLHANQPHRFTDVDGDSDLDYVFVLPNGGGLRWLELQPNREYGPEQALLVPTGSEEVYVFEMGDLDGDGWDDLVALVAGVSASTEPIGMYRGLAGGGFDATLQLVTRTANPGAYKHLHVADLDGDGDQDLVWRTNSPPRIDGAENLGGGTFGPPLALVTPAFPPNDEFELVDVDGNGLLDLVLHTDRARFWRATAPWQFGPVEDLVEPRFEEGEFALADIDRDGDLDAIRTDFGLGLVDWFRSAQFTSVGDSECAPAVRNSTGRSGRLVVQGSSELTLNRVELRAQELPRSNVVQFLTSQNAAFVPGSNGSAGTLCLGGPIGRAPITGIVDADGAAFLPIDLFALPQPTGAVAASIGETWRFQAWYRDTALGPASTNFTNSVAVTLQ